MGGRYGGKIIIFLHITFRSTFFGNPPMDGKIFAWNANNGMEIGIDCTRRLIGDAGTKGCGVMDEWLG